MAKVFISSTTEDLREHRQAVIRVLRQLGHESLVTENLAADAYRAPIDVSRDSIASCDVFIGIIAWRYGLILDRENPEGLSFVELEHRHAWAAGKPTLIFMTSDDAAWPPRFIDGGEQGERQSRFRRELLSRLTVSYFTSPADLAEKVTAALTIWERSEVRQEQTSPPSSPEAPSLSPNVDPFELAWRLVVDFKADPSLLRHMDLDQLQAAVNEWARAGGPADASPTDNQEAAQEQLRKKQTNLTPHPLWLAWMRTTRASLQPVREPGSHA